MADTTNGTATPEELPHGRAIRAGMAVYDANGERFGSVENAQPGMGYVEAKTSGVFRRDLYIPLDAVARVEEGSVHLKAAKGDLDKLDWYLPPTNGVDVDTPYSPSSGTETEYGQGGERPEPSPPPQAVAADASATDDHTDTLPQALAPDGPRTSDNDARGESILAVPVAEEHLEARTHREAAGAGTAQVHKVISSEPRSLDVPVTHDELRVVRVHVSDDATARALGPDVFTDKDIDIPLMGEQVELEKRARVTEEVLVRRPRVTEQRTYTGEVRKERVWVEGTDGREIAAGGGYTAPAAAGEEHDLSDEDTITYDRLAQGQKGP